MTPTTSPTPRKEGKSPLDGPRRKPSPTGGRERKRKGGDGLGWGDGGKMARGMSMGRR